MIKTMHGKAHGRTIELDEDLGVADGQEIEIHVRMVSNMPRAPGEGLLRTEGALANDEEWDSVMAEVHQSRKLERRPPLADLGAE
jgi:hypothetical protein